MYTRSKNGLTYYFKPFIFSMILVAPLQAQANPESIIQIFQRLETVEQKARELTGENEVLRNQIRQLQKTQKESFLGVDEQIDAIRQQLSKQDYQVVQIPNTVETNKTETRVVAAAKAKAPVKTTPKPSTYKPAVTVKSDGIKTIAASAAEKKAAASKGKTRAPSAYEKQTYQAAFNKMSASPTAATNAFKQYIKLQPNSPLAANAQYWIGEIMYSHNNYKGAVQEFIKVLQQYKTSNKAPDAAIKLGYSFYALKNWTYARRTFEDVLKYFPDNKNAVNLATKRLEKMKAAGN